MLSPTSLLQKLKLTEDKKVCIIGDVPKWFLHQIAETMPALLVTRALDSQFDYIQLFITDRQQLEIDFPKLVKHLVAGGCIWISWPKKAARVRTDITENIVREIGLPLGVVDTKVCAIDDTWSGLLFYHRKT